MLSYGLAAACSTNGLVLKSATVARVYDGDTIGLADGTKVRIIGINTPETKKHSEPYSQAAKAMLKSLISGKKVLLLPDSEKKDKYGRSLYHIWHKEVNISAAMLRSGLAQLLLIPPNVKFATCYKKAQDYAKQRKDNLWSTGIKRTSFTPKTAVVNRIKHTRNSIWLLLSNNLKVRIARTDLAYFNDLCLECLVGKKITVLAWWQKNKKGYYARLYHPFMLE